MTILNIGECLEISFIQCTCRKSHAHTIPNSDAFNEKHTQRGLVRTNKMNLKEL